MRFLPSRRRIGVWWQRHRLVPPEPACFRVLLADLHGDDEARTQTRHLETALGDQPGIAIMPVGETLRIADGEIDPAALGQCRSLIAGRNGDSLMFGEVMPKAPRIRIRMVGRYEQEAGRHGPYQMDWTELPKHFGPDVEGLLLALTALSVAPAAQTDQDRACLVDLLRPAATKLTRLLEQPGGTVDSERQGVFWHALGIAASLLGEHAQSQRWPEVAVHAHRTALLLWQQETVLFPWAMVQNNLGHALRLLAARQSDRQQQMLLLRQATLAFQEALRIYRTAAVADFYRRQTETNLAHAEALLAERPIVAA